MSIRTEKIQKLIKEEISLIFLHKIQDPELGLTTITKVKITPDLRSAKVYVSILDRDKREESLNKINDLRTLIRTELAHRVRLRHVPELTFFIDDSLDYAEKIEDIFRKIHENDKQEDE
jgi:ribosome-binding factor A